MDLKQLSYFITVVEEGNISLASKKLHMSQPPLSNQMKLLEEELNCVLFERGSRKIILTEAGRILYHKAVAMVSMADQTKQMINDHNEGLIGTLRIGVISSVGSTLIAKWLKGFHDKYPNVHFEITEANTYELLDKIQNNLLEFAIIRTPFHASGLHIEYLKEESMMAVGTKEYFETGKNSISMKELSKFPIIYYRRWQAILDEAFANQNCAANVVCINDDARTTAYLSESGLGVGILPESALLLLKPDLCIAKKISDSRLNSKIAIVYHDNTHLSTIAKNLIDYITHLEQAD